MSAEPGRAHTVLRAEDIRAGYGAGDIIHGISVSVASRAVASVVGPNGSGKSTLLKALAGVVRPSSGRVLAGDRDITGLAPEEVARAGVGYVPQTDDVFAPLTVRENLEMGGYLLPGREVSARIEHVVGVFPRLGQMLTRRAGRLSGGERKMLAMGRVLMIQPAVFLLDEPTANLAPQVAAELLTGHVRALAEAGAAVLIVEQRARAVLAISDYTYVLGGGQVLMADTPAAWPPAGSSPSPSSAPSRRAPIPLRLPVTSATRPSSRHRSFVPAPGTAGPASFIVPPREPGRPGHGAVPRATWGEPTGAPRRRG